MAFEEWLLDAVVQLEWVLDCQSAGVGVRCANRVFWKEKARSTRTLCSQLYALGKTASMAEEDSEVELDRLKEELDSVLIDSLSDEHGHISKSYCAKFCKVGYELLHRNIIKMVPGIVVPKELARKATP